jgi:hypothetical protein
MDTSEWSSTKQIGPWVVPVCPDCDGIDPDDGSVGLFGKSLLGHRDDCPRATESQA